ncbi:MAG: hypothetical protein OHK0052_00800 [Anaerolineales bacterium]
MQNAERMLRTYQQLPWRRQLQFAGLFLFGVIGLALLASVYLSVTARSATVGRQIQALQNDIQRMNLEIADSQMQLAEAQASRTMQARAEKLGLLPVSAEQIVYLHVVGYTPPAAIRLAPPPGPLQGTRPTLSYQYSQSLIDFLYETYSNLRNRNLLAEGRASP